MGSNKRLISTQVAAPTADYYLFASDAGGLQSQFTAHFGGGQNNYSVPSGYSMWGGAFDPPNSITSACSGGSSTLSFTSSNRVATKSGAGYYVAGFSNFTRNDDRWYAELVFNSPDVAFGITRERVCPFTTTFNSNSIRYYSWSGGIVNGIDGNSYSGTSWATSGTVVAIAVNFYTSEFTFYRNNTSQGTYSFTK